MAGSPWDIIFPEVITLEKIRVYCVVEKTDGEYLAYCDEMRATASGDTEEEALENLKNAIKELVDCYGFKKCLAPKSSSRFGVKKWEGARDEKSE